jgi:hypothetical protein
LKFIPTSVYNIYCENLFSFLLLFILGMTPDNTTPEEEMLETTVTETVESPKVSDVIEESD